MPIRFAIITSTAALAVAQDCQAGETSDVCLVQTEAKVKVHEQSDVSELLQEEATFVNKDWRAILRALMHNQKNSESLLQEYSEMSADEQKQLLQEAADEQEELLSSRQLLQNKKESEMSDQMQLLQEFSDLSADTQEELLQEHSEMSTGDQMKLLQMFHDLSTDEKMELLQQYSEISQDDQTQFLQEASEVSAEQQFSGKAMGWFRSRKKRMTVDPVKFLNGFMNLMMSQFK